MQCMFHLYSKPDGALAQKVLEVTTCKNPANAVAKLNTNKSEDSKHMIATVWFMCVFKSSPGNKKASDSEYCSANWCSIY